MTEIIGRANDEESRERCKKLKKTTEGHKDSFGSSLMIRIFELANKTLTEWRCELWRLEMIPISVAKSQ